MPLNVYASFKHSQLKIVIAQQNRRRVYCIL